MVTASILSSRAIRGMFYATLTERERASWVGSVANTFTSDQDFETYPFLGQVPELREWVGGRHRTTPKGQSVVIRNRKFERTLEFSVDELRRDKTPQIQARINDLAARAAALPQRELISLLQTNGNSYDGIAFFGDHTSGSGMRINNALTDSSIASATAPTSAEMSKGILDCVQRLYGALDDQGVPINEDAQEFHVLVPTLYWQATIAALGDQFTSAGVSNTMQSAFSTGLKIIPHVSARLTAPSSTGVFYVFRTDVGQRSLIWQDEVAADFDELAEGSDHEFWNDSHVYGVKRIGACGLGEHAQAARMTFS